MHFDKNGILHLVGFGEGFISIQDYQKMLSDIGSYTGGKKVLVYCISGEFLIPDEDVRAEMAKKDGNPYSLATALMVKSLSQKLMFNFFLKVMRPKRKIKMFTDEQAALEWLNGFKNLEQ